MSKSYAKNRKAFHDYEILEEMEAGIVLNGDEVKSIKNGRVNLKGSFVSTLTNQALIKNMHISRYEHSSRKTHDPVRDRKLILHKKEIIKIDQSVSQKGITVIPLELYGKKGLIKARIGICRGKKLHDKRETLKRKDQNRQIQRELKNF